MNAGPDWTDLPAEVVEHLFKDFGPMNLHLVCKTWSDALAESIGGHARWQQVLGAGYNIDSRSAAVKLTRELYIRGDWRTLGFAIEKIKEKSDALLFWSALYNCLNGYTLRPATSSGNVIKCFDLVNSGIQEISNEPLATGLHSIDIRRAQDGLHLELCAAARVGKCKAVRHILSKGFNRYAAWAVENVAPLCSVLMHDLLVQAPTLRLLNLEIAVDRAAEAGNMPSVLVLLDPETNNNNSATVASACVGAARGGREELVRRTWGRLLDLKLATAKRNEVGAAMLKASMQGPGHYRLIRLQPPRIQCIEFMVQVAQVPVSPDNLDELIRFDNVDLFRCLHNALTRQGGNIPVSRIWEWVQRAPSSELMRELLRIGADPISSGSHST